MRYAKGSVALSEDRDIPLLLLIRNSQYISQKQLMTLAGYGGSHSQDVNFRWRLNRLIREKYVEVINQTVSAGKVCTITHLGLKQLERMGYGLLSLHSQMRDIHHPQRMSHALELAEMRIGLARTAKAVKWATDVEVCSENMRTGEKYAKDYDAVVQVEIDEAVLVCAIEYERIPKAVPRYAAIARMLRAERQVDAILYVVHEVGNVSLVCDQLAGVHYCILFTSEAAFRKSALNAYALRSATEGAPIMRFLRCVARKKRQSSPAETSRSDALACPPA